MRRNDCQLYTNESIDTPETVDVVFIYIYTSSQGWEKEEVLHNITLEDTFIQSNLGTFYTCILHGSNILEDMKQHPSVRFPPLIRVRVAGAASSVGNPRQPSPRPLPPAPPGGS